MATKTDIELKIVDSVDTSHTETEVLADSASNPDAFYVGRGYLAHNGEKVIKGIDTDGTYPNMTVGKATKADTANRADFATDLSGRVEATPEVFTYRPSAGDKSIKDDNAFIRRVKGNSVVWNNQAIPLTADYEWLTNKARMKFTFVDGVATGVYVGAGLAYICNSVNRNTITGHKYYRAMTLTATKGGVVKIGEFGQQQTISNIQSNVGRYDTIFTSIGDAPLWGFIPDDSWVAGDVCSITNLLDIDLTQMFGAGNEPTTVEEFRALYPDTYYPYNAGELRNLDCSGIRTVGFNQWDEQWETGSLNSVGDNDNTSTTIRSKNYIPAIGNTDYYVGITSEGYDNIYYLAVSWYDSKKNFISRTYCNRRVITSPSNAAYLRFDTNTNSYVYGNTYNNDICINLHHTGYRDGEYEPYKEVTHALPLSQITNGEPLRKAGSDVYDEVNNDYYIRRVGVRSYTEGDKDDATLLTDGTYTNYPLSEPIVTPITTPIDFNYYVEDFGTEEALLAEDSAPFSADIVYQFNATDQVRNNSRAIQWLKKSAFIPSGTTAQYVRGDGSYGDVTEISQAISIYDGEMDSPDESEYDYEFTLHPWRYANAVEALDGDYTVLIKLDAPDNATLLAEYWLQLSINDTIPSVSYNPQNKIHLKGTIEPNSVNIWHLFSADGGLTYFGEITNYYNG